MFTAVFVGLLIVRTDWRETGDALAEAEYRWVAPAIAVSFGTMWVRSLRWRYVLQPVTESKTNTLYPLLVVGYMANGLLPARAGEFVRAYLVGNRYHVSRMAVLGTVAIERLFDGVVLVALFFIFAPALDPNETLTTLAILMTFAFALMVAFVFFLTSSEERSERLGRFLFARLPDTMSDSLNEWWSAFLKGLRGLRSPRTLGLVTGATTATWLLEAVSYLLMARAFDIHEGYLVFVVTAAAANLAISVPSSQGGIGPFEFFAREVMVLTGVSAGVATAYAIALHAVLLLPVIVAGLIIVAVTDVTLPAALGRELLPEDDTDGAAGQPSPAPAPAPGGDR